MIPEEVRITSVLNPIWRPGANAVGNEFSGYGQRVEPHTTSEGLPKKFSVEAGPNVGSAWGGPDIYDRDKQNSSPVRGVRS